LSTVYIRFVVGGSPPQQRSPPIERLIARASMSSRVANWRAEAFGLVAPGVPMPPVAVMALQGSADTVRTPPGAWVCVATPVHLSAGMTHVIFPMDGILQLELADAAALAAGFNTVFDGAGMRLVVGRAASLIFVFDHAMDVVTCDPEAAVGQDVFGFQPAGAGAPPLRKLMSEIEMWLFDHPVNRQRTARALPPITGLWLWGGGVVDANIPALPVWAAGQDVFFGAFGDASRDTGSGVVILDDCPGSSTWPEVEQRWLRPAVAELRAGRIGHIHLSAAQRRFTITRALNWRFWRRARPWWQSFDTSVGELRGADEHGN
jgi:hypothetical protein